MYREQPHRLSHSILRPAELVTLSTQIEGHAHDYLQVVISLQGKVTFDINGVGNQMIPGQGCIVTSNSDHAFGSVSTSSNIIVINIIASPEYDSSIWDQINELARIDYYFQLNDPTRQLITMLAKEMLASPSDMLLSQACNHTIIALLRKHAMAFQTHHRVGRLDITRIDSYIQEHITNKISVTQLAGSIYLCESQFHTLFKQQTGKTPHQYVLLKRVEYAKELIESGTSNLSYVADKIGFSGQSAFTHAFSKYEGITPSQYKKRFFC